MIYVDTSVLIPLCVLEPKSAAASAWYEAYDGRIVSAFWCVTEFASSLGIKQRTKQLTKREARTCWSNFEKLCSDDLELLPVESQHFVKAAALTHNAASGLRSGDALHLSVALGAKLKEMATLDMVLAANAKRLKFRLVPL
jgi:uncharacterized protein